SLHELANRGWEELSHGERKRFQIGCALITRPDLLIVDEPTNHLDGSNRAYVIEALKDFSGIGIVVSHDRELLNKICNHCLIHDGRNFVMLAGDYTAAAAGLDALKDARMNRSSNLENKARQLRKEVVRLDEIDRSS